MSEAAETPPAILPTKQLTMLEMAEFAGSELVSKCEMLGGGFAGQTVLVLDARRAAVLDQIVRTLAVLAQHDAVIKQAIRQTGWRKR